MQHSAPAPKCKHSLWQCIKSHPAYVALCGAVRAWANSEKIAAHMHESRRCVVLRRDMLTGAALPTRFVRGLRLIWLACDCSCQRASRAEPRRDQAQALAHRRLAARTGSEHSSCPGAFCPPERCFDAVRAQFRPVSCHHQSLDVVAVVCQHHEIH